MRPGWGSRLALLAVSLLIALLALELGVRWLMPQQLIVFEPGLWIPDQTGLGHRLAPNADRSINTGEREVRVLTDADGFRIGEGSPPAAARTTVLALGDSFLEAFAVPHTDSIVGQLERLLSEAWEEPVRVLNTGVSGSNPNHYRIRAERVLERQPIQAVVVFLFLGNDIVGERLESYPPRSSALKGDLSWPGRLTWRELMSSIVHPVYTRLRMQSHLVVLLKDRLLSAFVRFGFSDHAFPDLLLRSEADSARFGVTAEIAREIAGLAEEHGSGALFVLLPADYQVDPSLGEAFAGSAGLSPSAFDLDQTRRRLREELDARDLAVLDATPLLKLAFEAGEAPYGRVDRHLSPAGQSRVAEAVAQRLVAEGGTTRKRSP